MEKSKKFFFTKEDNAINIIGKVTEKEMSQIVGGLAYKSKLAETNPAPYTESTYVRK
jgi:filamentous hemagglutinin family protein